ncbi:MAG: TRAP transporter substrate-binding protein [Fretibacterium sp.]|nr:TRAP transporter substrate-binding protein [Fretibacterium sp.]
MKKILSSLVLAVLVLGGYLVFGKSGSSTGPQPTGDSQEKFEWIAYSTWPESNHHTIGLKEFAQRVEEATGGRVKMTVHSGGALGYKGTEILSVVRDNLVQVSDMSLGNVAGEEPVFGITTLPFMLQDMQEGYTLNQLARDGYNDLLSKKWGQIILYTAPWPMAGFWTQKEIRVIEDLKGTKMRTYDRNTGLVVSALGGTPYPLPFADVYSSLATGAINSCLTSTPTAVDAKFWEVLKYYTPTSVAMTQDAVTINLNVFNKLPEDLQKIVLSVGEEMQKKMWEEVGPKLDKTMEDLCVKKGIIVTQPSEEFIAALYNQTKDIREDWLKNAPEEAKKIYADFMAKIGR